MNVKIKTLINALIALVFFLTVSGCSVASKSYKERTLGDMYPILTDDEYETLTWLNRDEEILAFLDRYWAKIDTAYGTEIKVEYMKRLQYANEKFPDRRGSGMSDRKRIYVLHGPPDAIEHSEFSNAKLGTHSTMKSSEIWLYSTPGRYSSLPAYGDDVHIGWKKFIFADLTGGGNYEIIYSTEDPDDIDVRMLKHN